MNTNLDFGRFQGCYFKENPWQGQQKLEKPTTKILPLRYHFLSHWFSPWCSFRASSSKSYWPGLGRHGWGLRADAEVAPVELENHPCLCLWSEFLYTHQYIYIIIYICNYIIYICTCVYTYYVYPDAWCKTYMHTNTCMTPEPTKPCWPTELTFYIEFRQKSHIWLLCTPKKVIYDCLAPSNTQKL